MNPFRSISLTENLTMGKSLTGILIVKDVQRSVSVRFLFRFAVVRICSILSFVISNCNRYRLLQCLVFSLLPEQVVIDYIFPLSGLHRVCGLSWFEGVVLL